MVAGDRVIASYTVSRDGRVTKEPRASDYIVGLDLGKSADYTALTGLEIQYTQTEDPKDATFICRHLERLKLGVSYPDQVEHVRRVCLREPLLSHRPTLAIDQTGVGAAVVDLFKRAEINADLRPILIHGGNEITTEHGVYHVPKRELVGTAQVVLSTGKLIFSGHFTLKEVLIQELQNFQVKISDSGFDSYEARSGLHDDLVLSLSMALWMGRRRRSWKMY